MKNHHSEVITEIKKAGYIFIRLGRHGAIYRKDIDTITVPARIDTQKIANNLIRQASRQP